jgi:hypothetical protein
MGARQQSQGASSHPQDAAAGLHQPALLDLQHKYGVVWEHVSRKEIKSGLHAIASIAALRACVIDLTDATLMRSAAWFGVVREQIDEKLV